MNTTANPPMSTRLTLGIAAVALLCTGYAAAWRTWSDRAQFDAVAAQYRQTAIERARPR
jgi:hypothetical protein